MEPVSKEPNKASSVVLVREVPETDGGSRLETYLTRRRPDLKFLGGATVFPGGSVDEQDTSPGILARSRGRTEAEASRILETDGDVIDCIGHWTAALRELFEEVFVLLARRSDGSAPDFSDLRMRERLRKGRDRLHAGEAGFDEILAAEDLFLDLGGLVYLSHWITPEYVPTRFDTRFFAALIPEGAEPVCDPMEIDRGMWLPVPEALALWERREIIMIPPQLDNLMHVGGFQTWAALVEAFA